MMIPTGQIRVPFNREFGLQIADKLREECEALPKESNLTVATDLKGAADLANLEKRFRA